MPLSSLFWFCLSSSSWLFSATTLLCLCRSMPCFFFPHLPPFFFAFYRAKAENVFSASSACFSKEIVLWSKGCSLGATALCFMFFLFSLLLSFSLVFLFPEYPSNTSPLPANGSFSASLSFHQAPVGLLILFSLPVSCSCLPADFHSLCCWKWGSGENWFFHLLCINLLEKISLPITVERKTKKKKKAGLGLFLFPLGFIPFFLSYQLGLCYAGQTKNRSDGRVDSTGPRCVSSWITGTETSSEVKIKP